MIQLHFGDGTWHLSLSRERDKRSFVSFYDLILHTVPKTKFSSILRLASVLTAWSATIMVNGIKCYLPYDIIICVDTSSTNSDYPLHAHRFCLIS